MKYKHKWPSGLRRCVQVAVHFGERRFESCLVQCFSTHQFLIYLLLIIKQTASINVHLLDFFSFILQKWIVKIIDGWWRLSIFYKKEYDVLIMMWKAYVIRQKFVKLTNVNCTPHLFFEQILANLLLFSRWWKQDKRKFKTIWMNTYRWKQTTLHFIRTKMAHETSKKCEKCGKEYSISAKT